MATTNNTDRKMEVIIKTLESLDKQLNDMIVNIMMEKNTEDMNTIGAVSDQKTIDAKVISQYMRTINSIDIGDREEVLVKISEKYDSAVNVLKDAIKTEDPVYRKQFESELARLEANKTANFTPIVLTYGEIKDRLERGEAQVGYFEDKIKEREQEIKDKEEQYEEKRGNLRTLPRKLQKEMNQIEEKHHVSELYRQLIKLNQDIKTLNDEITNGSLSQEEKEEKNYELEKLKQIRARRVAEFVATAKDKDGKKYEKAEGKSDEEYINELDVNKINEAVDDALYKFNDKILAMPEEERKFTRLDQNMQEGAVIDILNHRPANVRDARKLIQFLTEQNALWNNAEKLQGFDRQKIKREIKDYQDKIDSYNEVIQYGDDFEYALSVDNGTTYRQRYAFNRQTSGRIKSFFKSIFMRSATEEEMMAQFAVPEQFGDIDIEESKREALRYITKNRNRMNPLKDNEKRDKDDFKRRLNYNVGITEGELKAFWNKKENQARDDENTR